MQNRKNRKKEPRVRRAAVIFGAEERFRDYLGSRYRTPFGSAAAGAEIGGNVRIHASSTNGLRASQVLITPGACAKISELRYILFSGECSVRTCIL